MATTRIVNIGDLDPVLKRLKGFNVALTRQFRQAMEMSVNELLMQVVKRTPTGVSSSQQGNLVGSIHSDVYGTPKGLFGSVATAQLYGLPVEEGTKPHFPPETALWDWVRLKLGISDKQEMISVAYLIALKISHHGTKGKHMFRDGYTAAEPKMKRWFVSAFHRIAKSIG